MLTARGVATRASNRICSSMNVAEISISSDRLHTQYCSVFKTTQRKMSLSEYLENTRGRLASMTLRHGYPGLLHPRTDY